MQVRVMNNYTFESGVQVMIGIVLLTGMETHRRDDGDAGDNGGLRYQGK